MNLEDSINFQFAIDTFKNQKPFSYIKVLNALDESFAIKIQQEILNIPHKDWDRYENPFEHKYTLRNKENMPFECNKLFNILTSSYFTDYLSGVMGYEIMNDPTKNWWGIHKYNDGDYLDIHVDAGIHPQTKQKKQLTLGIYLSKDWKEENGGHLEIWEGENASIIDAKLINCCDKILPLFNTLILFECNDYAWHGNPTPVNCKNGETRIFVTVSYVSEQYNDLNKKERAFFIKKPEDSENITKEKIRLLRCDSVKYKDVYKVPMTQL